MLTFWTDIFVNFSIIRADILLFVTILSSLDFLQVAAEEEGVVEVEAGEVRSKKLLK